MNRQPNERQRNQTQPWTITAIPSRISARNCHPGPQDAVLCGLRLRDLLFASEARIDE